MKWIVAAMALIFTTHASATTVQITSGKKKVTQITTDCFYDIKNPSSVVLRPLGKIRKHGRVILVVDGQKMVCRIKDINRIP